MKDSSVKLIKAQSIINGITPEELGQRLWTETIEKKKQQDETLLEHEVLDKNDNDELRILYQQYKLPWPLSNRSILFFSAVRRDEEGGRFHIGNSIENQALIQEGVRDNSVRAQLCHSAYVFQPVKDQNATRVTYVVQLDPKGNIPMTFVNANVGRGASRVAQIKNDVEKQ